MSKKIAFFDIDGTMVNVPNGLLHPTPETIRVLNEFKKQGNYIVVATARGVLPDSVKDIKFNGYICNDGHYIVFNDEVLVDDIFTCDEIERQIDIYSKFDGRFMFGGHASSWNSFLDDTLVIEHRKMFSGTSERPQGVVEEFKASDVEAVSCCVLFDSIEKLEACYEELKDSFIIVPYRTGLIRMDVYREGFTKGTACEYLYKKLEIEKEKSYAFGDGINDKEMLELVGHGIAMGNALEEIKQIADDVTDTVDNDGIAKAFKRYFNI
ncbi:Cof-type HAD-IIB family hydrolase [Clostridium saudiense]|nr:Cof-type HAD-IIB family hydrolase [Clostridium saudiense]